MKRFLLFWLLLASLWCSHANAQPLASRSPAPILWADGLTQTADLDAYKQSGFNTVIVRLTWTPSPAGELSAADLAPQRAFANAAAARGLDVVYALPAAPQGFEGSFRVAADSPAYLALWNAWADVAFNSLADTPRLKGWMLPDDPRGLPIFDDAGFGRWVSRNYANVGVLNAQWETNYADISDISIADVEALAAPRSSLAPTPMASSTTTAANTRAWHPASLALAAYKWDAYRELLAFWVGAVRGADDGRHLVFSGTLPDYAQLLSLPEGIDVSVPSIVPGVAENDIVTHNPQAIDIARRGGKFRALPVFAARESPFLPAGALPELAERWIETAHARGAAGVGFDSWNGLRRQKSLLEAVSTKLQTLKNGPIHLWNEAPVATLAVVLTPLADGSTPQFGTPPNQFPRGLYGFGDSLVEGEPSNLVWALRWGTAFGGVDYLSPDDLSAPLERYTTILAPQMLSCSLETASHLSDYVANGGTLVADLGLGALQNGGSAGALPSPMALLFGVPGNYEIQTTDFNLRGVAGHELFPSWSRTIEGRSGVIMTQGDGPGSSAFVGPVGFSVVPPLAHMLAMGPQIPKNLGAAKNFARAPLTVHEVGRGYAVFAPFRLWSNWRPGLVGFDAFHGELWARGATLGVGGTPGEAVTALVPLPVGALEGQTRFPEVVNRGRSVSFLNHDAPGQPVKLASVQTTGAGDWLWRGGIALLSNANDALLSAGRPAPVWNPDSFQSRPRPLFLFANPKAGEAQTLDMVPIALQNVGGGPLCAQVVRADSAFLEINVWPNSPQVLASNDEQGWQPIVTKGGGACRILVEGGPTARFDAAPSAYTSNAEKRPVDEAESNSFYRVTPGSKHRVVVVDYTRQVKKGFHTKELIITADARGRLLWDFEGGACSVKVSPALMTGK